MKFRQKRLIHSMKNYLKQALTTKNTSCIIIFVANERTHTFHSSSVVEQSAVNRSVAGSNPACGAIRRSTQVAEGAPLLRE